MKHKKSQDSMNSYLFFILHTTRVCHSKIFINKEFARNRQLQSNTNSVLTIFVVSWIVLICDLLTPMGLINCICPYLWVYFTHFDYWNLTSSGQMITHTGATKKGLFSIISLILTTDNNSDIITRSMSSFLLWYVPPLKAKTLFLPHILLHSPYLCQ